MSYDGPDRRDYDENGFGRRPYDGHHCPFYDEEKHKCGEVEALKKSIVPRWIFTLYVTTAGAAMIGLLAVAWNFSAKALDKVDLVSTKMTGLTVQTSIISTKQTNIIEDIKEIKRKELRNERRKSVMDRLGDDRDQPDSPRNNPTGSFGGD